MATSLNVTIQQSGGGQWRYSGDLNGSAQWRSDLPGWQITGDITGNCYLRQDGTAQIIGTSNNSTYSGAVSLSVFAYSTGQLVVAGSIGSASISQTAQMLGTGQVVAYGSTVSFTPTAVPNLELFYWVPSETTYSNGNAMGQLTDFSGKARHATASGTLRPTYTTGVLNGYPSARFAGAQGLVTPTLDLSGTQAVTIFALFNATSGADECIIEQSTNLNNFTDGFLLYRESINTVQAFAKGNVGNSVWRTATSLTTTPRLISTVLDKSQASGSEAIAYYNGLQDGSAIASAENTNNFGNRACYIGARAQASLFLNGDLYGLLVYSRALTTAERQNVENWINTNIGNLYFVFTPSMLADSETSTNQGTYYESSSLARALIATTAASIEVKTYSTNNSSGIGIRANGANVTRSGSSLGNNTYTQTLPGGTTSVELISGYRSTDQTTTTGNYLVRAQCIGSTTANSVSVPGYSTRLTVYADSISVGVASTNPELDAWTQQLRDLTTSKSIIAEGWNGRTLYQDVFASGNSALVAQIASASPNIIWLAIGVNDYILNKWTPSNFGTAYAALLDALHSALPSTSIYAQSMIVKSTEGANSLGFTLPQYRTAVQTAAQARAWCNFVDGTTILTTADLAADGLHPTTAGALKYAQFVKTVLGF